MQSGLKSYSRKSVRELRAILAGDPVVAAEELLGAILVRGKMSARIVELEAYDTPSDLGCHAHRGKTPRNEVMFGEPGHAYVYFTYGNHWMLNIVAREEGRAGAVLVRAAQPLTGIEQMWERRPKARRIEDLLSGPGKLAAAFGITKRDNGIDLLSQTPLHIVAGAKPLRCIAGTRIGLAVGKGDDLPWRFIDSDALRWASKPWPRP